MDRLEIDYSKIDQEIKEVVFELNQIPFLTTLFSCSGHLFNEWPRLEEGTDARSIRGLYKIKEGKSLPRVIAEKGYGFITPGYLIYNIEMKNNNSKKFLVDLLDLEFKYSFVSSTRRLAYNYEGFDLSGNREIFLNYEDLLHAKKDFNSNKKITPIIPTNSIEETVKTKFQVKIEEGEKRIKEFQEVWEELLNIAKGHH